MDERFRRDAYASFSSQWYVSLIDNNIHSSSLSDSRKKEPTKKHTYYKITLVSIFLVFGMRLGLNALDVSLESLTYFLKSWQERIQVLSLECR